LSALSEGSYDFGLVDGLRTKNAGVIRSTFAQCIDLIGLTVSFLYEQWDWA